MLRNNYFRAWYFNGAFLNGGEKGAAGLTFFGTIGVQPTYTGHLWIAGMYEGVLTIEPS